MTLKSHHYTHNFKRKNHKKKHKNVGNMNLKFIYHRGPQKQSRPKGPNNLCSATVDTYCYFSFFLFYLELENI
jgi:hypothetical protein